MAAKAKPKPAPAERAPEGVRAPAPPLPPVMPAELLGEVPLAQVRPCPFNIRKAFPPEDIAALAESIRAEGLLNRLIVRPVGPPGKAPTFAAGKGWSDLSHYELADGERRFRALSLLDETHTNDAGAPTKVPVVIRPLTDEQALAMMVTTREQSRELAPSELLAGYVELRARKGDDVKVAAAVGKPVGHVRGVLRLAKLPPWALAAVDAGTLPRATAELVARVPGEAGRKRCAACVLLGCHDPSRLLPDDVVGLERGDASVWAPGDEALSYRDTKDLIRNHFTKELKGAPFSLKVLYPEPGAGDPEPQHYIQSCDECPKRAGNDPEALADGTRPDVCLDPECYRAKVKAYQAQEVARAAEKGVEEAPIDGGFAQVPKGWCDVSQVVWMTDLAADFPVRDANPKREEKLDKLLAAPGAVSVPRFIEFDRTGHAVTLVRTEDARTALRSIGVLKKPERAKPTPSTNAGSKAGTTAPGSGKIPAGPSGSEVARLATLLAADVLGGYGADQFGALADLDDAREDGPILEGLRLIVRALAYDSLLCGGTLRRDWLAKRFPGVTGDGKDRTADEGAIDALAGDWAAPRALAFVLESAAISELELGDGPNRVTGLSLLGFAELDWGQLTEQARRELTGGEPAAEKVAKADREFIAEQQAKSAAESPDPDPMLSADGTFPHLGSLVSAIAAAKSAAELDEIAERLEKESNWSKAARDQATKQLAPHFESRRAVLAAEPDEPRKEPDTEVKGGKRKGKAKPAAT